MGIQRQMVGKEIDVVGQQQADALLEPARDAAIHAAPEQAVVHEDGIGLRLDGRLDQRAAGRHPADDAADLAAPLHLQAVGTIVLEALGLQQTVEVGQEFLSRGAHERIVSDPCGAQEKGQPCCPSFHCQAQPRLGCQPRQARGQKPMAAPRMPMAAT